MSKTNVTVILISIAALISLGISVYLWFTGQKESGLFVGIWVPTILSLGAFLKK